MSDASDAEWLLITLDDKLARRQGVPPRVPVPKGDFEGIAERGLETGRLKTWITAFLGIVPPRWRTENVALAASFDRFVSKVDLWNRAQSAFASNDFTTAISTLKLVCRLDPDDHAAKMNLGSALASTGDHAAALKELEAIRATFEGEADYHTTVGQLHAALGARDAAIDELVLALESKADHRTALDLLKQLGVLVALYENPRDAASLTYVRKDAILEYFTSQWDRQDQLHDGTYYLEQAAYHASEGWFDVALAAAERAERIAISPPGDDVLRERAAIARTIALRSLGRTSEAVDSAKELVLRRPESSQALVELAQALSQAGEEAGARVAIDDALRADPGDLMAIDLAFWPKDRTDIALVDKALPALATFANQHPTVAGAWRSLARAKLVVGAIDEGLALFEKATSLAERDDDLRAEYWAELARVGRTADVIKDAATIADMPSRDWRLRWNEAEALAREGKIVEARAAFTQINFDESLLADVRKRAKRAANSVQAKRS